MVPDTVKQIAISYLVNLALEKAKSYLSNFLGDQKELEKIKVSLTEIRGFIDIAEGSPVLDPKLRELLERIKDAAYDAEDLLEEYEIEDRRRIQEPPQKKVRNLIPEVFNRPKLASELKDVSERLEAIKAECDKFQLIKTVANWESEFKRKRKTGSFIYNSKVLGREEEKKKLLSLLLSPDQDVLVIPIVGMGGIGKTTLAQFACNHEDVDDHFKLKMWICVSDDFDFIRLQNKIIERAAGGHPGGPGYSNIVDRFGVEIFERAFNGHRGGPGPSNVKKFDVEELQRSNVKIFDVEELQHRLREALSEKRFLLVLDDVWNEEFDEWERLKDLLICGGRGSRIVVTTRIRKVASIMGTIDPIVLEGLPADHCWSLFSGRAFTHQTEEEAYPNLEPIGHGILKKCKGNPLAVLTLGSLLCSQREERRWAYVRDSEIWNIANENEHGILPALRLSYNHLKPHLKQCFAFCAIFPKSYKIEKGQLIKLWMANGFIPFKTGLELEEIGNEIFDELVTKYFFQDVTTTYDNDVPETSDDFGRKRLSMNEITLFSMHDLFHDLAQSVMGDECYVMKEGHSVNISKRLRHFSYFDSTPSRLPDHLKQIPSIWHPPHPYMNGSYIYVSLFEAQMLHTFISGFRLQLHPPVGPFRFLRVLDLSTMAELALVIPLDNLKHLRYLDLSNSLFKKLPDSLTGLYYLQTLILMQCKQLQELPVDMRYLTNLRHLNIRGCQSLTHMPPKMGQLTCLQELTHFIVGKEIECSGIGELQCLNLRGRLIIERLRNIRNHIDVQRANLISKPNLTSLQLDWADGDPDSTYKTFDEVEEEQVLEGLQPHENLEVLKILNYGGIQFPSWMTDATLFRLEKICLIQCGRSNRLPSLGQLPLLKVLEIIRLKNVECIGDEFYGNTVSGGFPSLEEFTLCGMQKLTTWSGWKSGHVFPRLVRLKIFDCPILTKITCFEHLNIDSSLSSVEEPLRQGMLQKLIYLKIENCFLLEVFVGLQNLTSLKFVSLIKCNLLSFPDKDEMRSLISLQNLTIDSCERLVSLSKGLCHVSSLKNLKIKKCNRSTALPNELGFFTSLQVLKLKSCVYLKSLPERLGNLTSLQYLFIEGCHKMASLPEELQHLTELKGLFISGCPILSMRCGKNVGEDWHRIQHIPHICIRKKERS